MLSVNRLMLCTIASAIISCSSVHGAGFDAPLDSSIPGEKIGMLFLGIVNSANANGMGGCTATMVNEEASLYNPGALGLLHLNKFVAATAPFKTKWLPDVVSDLRLRSFAVSGGISARTIFPRRPQ